MAPTQSNTWPPNSGLCTPTVPRESAVLAVHGSTTINAPASLVLSIVREVDEYPKWNTWVPRVAINSQSDSAPDSRLLEIGTSFTYHVIMNAAKPGSETPTQLRVTDISTPAAPSSYISAETLAAEETYSADLGAVYRISWKSEGGFVSRGLSTERFHEVIETGADTCEVRTWEVMGGVLAHTVKWMYRRTLEEKFHLWCQELKVYAEDRAKEGGR